MENSPRNAPPPPGQAEESHQLRQYWHVVLERRWLIITTFTLVVLLGAVYAFKATPVYQAVARLQIDPESSGVLSLRESVSFNNRDQDYLQTQYRNLMSRTLIDKVSAKLKLTDDPRYKEKLDKIEAISRDITVSPMRLTRLVEVRARHPNPEKARAMANELLDIFLQENLDRKKLKTMEGLMLLKQEQATQESELERAIQDLQNYRVKQQSVSLDDAANVVTRSLLQAQEAFELQRIAAESAERTAIDGQKWKEAGSELADFTEIARDPLIQKLKGDLAMSQAQLAGLTNRYRARHPAFISAQATVAAAEKKLREESDRQLTALIDRSKSERAKSETSLAKRESASKEVERLNELRVRYEVLKGKRDRADQMFQLILQKTKEYDISQKDILQNMTIIDRADLPIKHLTPNRPLVISGSFLAGLLLALGLAFFINYLDDSVKSQEDVENYLRMPFLGYIPNIKSASVVERDLQAHLHPTSSAAEGFRTLRAAVSLARNAEKLRTISVSSTIPSEGKSLVASNYAIVLAQTGLRTLLVDADLRRPSVHKAFQLQSPVGLAAYLAERVNKVDEIIHTSEVPNLDIVCCGATPSNPSELISSKRMVQFLEEVSAKYDRIIMDCPPVSAVADPLVIGAMSDGLVYVTKFNKIRREHASRSVQRIGDAGIHIVGLVLNDIDFEGKDSYYYSYHYYQNRYYSSHYRTAGQGKGEAAKAAPART
ncbi:MAG: GumC family protein [Verrucomicrobiota bacterium]